MIQLVLDRLSHVRKRTGGWQARCPAHQDGGPSLSISEGNKAILMHCHAGCSITDVCAAIGLHPKDLFYDAPRKIEKHEADLDDYIIAIAKADLGRGKTLTEDEQQLYMEAIRRKHG